MAGSGRSALTRAPRWRSGDPITAAALNRLAAAADGAVTAVPAPAARAGQIEINGVTAAGEVWIEIDRQTSTVRVENPDDSSQYVDVERIDVVTFAGPDGRTMSLAFNN
jgi:hypothetical protein